MEQANIISTVCDIWCFGTSRRMLILVSSILGGGVGNTASQDQQYTES